MNIILPLFPLVKYFILIKHGRVDGSRQCLGEASFIKAASRKPLNSLEPAFCVPAKIIGIWNLRDSPAEVEGRKYLLC